ncbi:hypothetical protein [Haloarcula sp. JP-L23]|uniref:hypothetical protein n=1 Tax=Haloarcula sp. JP-L23 TaxID=2716717 RepID=UPI00140F2A3D|nr:hypothetical protein G9465_00485 [Haloarcula sp. JP-L23]
MGQGDHGGVEIANNTIQNLDQETTESSGFPTANGILFDADNADPGTVTDTTVNSNTIEGVESDLASLGIVVQHNTDAVNVDDNEIRDLVAASDTDSDPSDGEDFGFTFAQGVSIGISDNITGQALTTTADTTIAGNVIEDITSAAGYSRGSENRRRRERAHVQIEPVPRRRRPQQPERNRWRETSSV